MISRRSYIHFKLKTVEVSWTLPSTEGDAVRFFSTGPDFCHHKYCCQGVVFTLVLYLALLSVVIAIISILYLRRFGKRGIFCSFNVHNE